MPQNWTNDPIDGLNKRVDRLDGDVRAVRGEMKDGFRDVHREFTKVRSEMKDGFDGVSGEFTEVRKETKDEFTKVRSEMKAGFDGMSGEFTKVRSEVNAGFQSLYRLIIWGGSGMFLVLLAAIRL